MHYIHLAYSHLSSFAYHIDKGLLEICFRDGTTQHYLNVPSTIYFSLLHDYAPEKYFERFIRPVFRVIDIKKINYTYMEKQITVLYKIGDREDAVQVCYSIATNQNIQTISCNIRQVNFGSLHWLQLRKFEMKSMQSSEGFMPLFTDNANIKNKEAVLFIDKAYNAIMSREHFKIAEPE